MPDAKDYLSSGLKADRAELDRIRRLIDETAATLISVCIDRRWPYVVANGSTLERPKEVSASTNSMIAFALAVADGVLLKSPLAPQSPVRSPLGPKSAETLCGADLSALLGAAVQEALGDPYSDLVSATYGENDPFTLGWLVPLAAALRITWIRRDKTVAGRLAGAWSEDRVLFDPRHGDALQHAFPLLRVVQLAESAKKLDIPGATGWPPQLHDEFATIVHRQLSNSEIPDASFDPAELIFAFEGLLLCSSGRPSGALVDRFFDVVAEAQESSPSWRPLRPFIRTKTGLVLLPLGVEGAMSLARICLRLGEPSIGRLIDHFRTYLQWLEAQRVDITVNNQTLRGWHSEHVREPDTIYTWQTSQVLLFLVLYRELLQLNAAERALEAANLSVNRKPDAHAGPDSKAWRRVKATFIDQGGSQTGNRSAVLYGPPGTGKTTLAEWLAAELEWPLITVTPSDFMAQGTAAVEARAKAVFDALGQQRNAVVIFDEIDRLVLDRNRPEYHKSEGAFQMMTPSMLTKLNELRKTGEVIFLIATNYAERIDTAITRPGRFDEQILISPPEEADRAEFLKERWRKQRSREKLSAVEEERLTSVAAETCLSTYAELNRLVARSETLADLEKAVSEFVPAIALENYTKRMKSDRPPYQEVLELKNLLPPGYDLSDAAKTVIKKAEKAARRSTQKAKGTD